jgi:hypothetical protein
VTVEAKESVQSDVVEYRPRRYSPSRGGHAPGHLREPFIEMIETWYAERVWPKVVSAEHNYVPIERPIRWLLGQLWNCTDILGGSYDEMLEIEAPHKRTFGAAARHIAAMLAAG